MFAQCLLYHDEIFRYYRNEDLRNRTVHRTKSRHFSIAGQFFIICATLFETGRAKADPLQNTLVTRYRTNHARRPIAYP